MTEQKKVERVSCRKVGEVLPQDIEDLTIRHTAKLKADKSPPKLYNANWKQVQDGFEKGRSLEKGFCHCKENSSGQRMTVEWRQRPL